MRVKTICIKIENFDNYTFLYEIFEIETLNFSVNWSLCEFFYLKMSQNVKKANYGPVALEFICSLQNHNGLLPILTS